MHNLPHLYRVGASVTPDANVLLTSQRLTEIESAAPAEFGGPGDRWSPETLLSAAVADCFVLSFKAIARASKMEWETLSCDVEGVLDKAETLVRFTEFRLKVVLTVAAGSDEKKALRLLEKAEAACLITNSLKSTSHLHAEVRFSTTG